MELPATTGSGQGHSVRRLCKRGLGQRPSGDRGRAPGEIFDGFDVFSHTFLSFFDTRKIYETDRLGQLVAVKD